MKKFCLLLPVIFFCHQLKAQQKMNCCSAPSATLAFANFANDSHFKDAHPAPLPAHYQATGRMVTFTTPDGKAGKGYYVPSKKQTKNFIFVFHEWWGLNDWIKREADLLSDSITNANVLAIDLYDGRVADNADEAGKIMQSIVDDRARAIIKGAITFAGAGARIATIGWCWGGGWSLQAALLAGKNESGCVMYYGMPESDVNKLKMLNSDVLFMWADEDRWINARVKDDFMAHMKAAGKKLTVNAYHANHAFANPSNPDYNRQARDDADKKTLAYFRKTFAE